MYGDRRDDYLFLKHDMFALKDHQQKQMLAELDRIPGNQLLNSNADDLVVSYADKYSLTAPTLREDEIYTDEPMDVRVDVSQDRDRYIRDRGRPFYVSGTRIRIMVPFDGDAEMFRVKPSSSYLNALRGSVSEGELVYSQQSTQLDGGRVRAEFDRWLGEIRQYLEWQRADLRGFNEGLAATARQFIDQRRVKLLADQGIGKSLGFPLKKREGAPPTYRAPEVKRKIVPKMPAASSTKYVPEPELDTTEYDHILSVISSMVHVMERSPKAFHTLDEEGIRSHFIVQLNGHYEGQATGETFNYQGKTDILIRSGDRNVFVAECKLWSGPAKLTGTIDQLLGYLTWRDSKTAILLFNRNKDFSKVLAAIPDTVKAHPKFRKELTARGPSEFRYVFRHKDDDAKDLHLAVLAFDIPLPTDTR
jgi:hypothetical protein